MSFVEDALAQEQQEIQPYMHQIPQQQQQEEIQQTVLQHDIFEMDEGYKHLAITLYVQVVILFGQEMYACDHPGCINPVFESFDEAAQHVLDVHFNKYNCVWYA